MNQNREDRKRVGGLGMKAEKNKGAGRAKGKKWFMIFFFGKKYISSVSEHLSKL